MSPHRDQSGQASVELVALLPLLAALTIGAWQLVVVAQAWWLAGTASRAAARAAAVGGDPLVAARRALPGGRAGSVRVARSADGELTVRLAIPAVTGGISLGDASATLRHGGPPAASGERP